MLRRSLLRLICQTDASPKAQFHLYLNGSLVETSRSGIFNVAVVSDGLYTCVPFNTVGAGKDASVIVTAVGEFTSKHLCIKRIVKHCS